MLFVTPKGPRKLSEDRRSNYSRQRILLENERLGVSNEQSVFWMTRVCCHDSPTISK